MTLENLLHFVSSTLKTKANLMLIDTIYEDLLDYCNEVTFLLEKRPTNNTEKLMLVTAILFTLSLEQERLDPKFPKLVNDDYDLNLN